MLVNIDVDGIQFDDHFGLPSEMGYDAFTVKLYKQEHGGKRPPTNPQDPEWLRWRANKITAFMKRIFQAVKAQETQLPNINFSQPPACFLRLVFSRLAEMGTSWVN